MKRLLPLLLLPALGLVIWGALGSEADPAASPALRTNTQPVARRDATNRPELASDLLATPRRAAPVPRTPPTQVAQYPEELTKLWTVCATLHAIGRSGRALGLITPWLLSHPEFFREEARAKKLEAIRLASLTQEAQRTRLDEQLTGLVAEARKWKNLRDPGDGVTLLERALRDNAEMIARVENRRERDQLLRHVRRFVLRRPGGEAPRDPKDQRRDPLQVDALLGLVAERQSKEKGPRVALPIADPESAETRRLDQLRKLQERGATGFLDSIHASLAFLALHQGKDGRFSDGAVVEFAEKTRLAVSEYRPLRFRAKSDTYAVATTALALMAFLDFRDQDVTGLFEPTIQKAITWLIAKQNVEGSFQANRALYGQAIVVMALSQAALATGDEDIKSAAARGLVWLHDQNDPLAGYRYKKDQAGDLSVTGWVAQALQMATWAGIPEPKGMWQGLHLFTQRLTTEDGRFGYSSPSPRDSLLPVGILIHLMDGEVLYDAETPQVRTWSTALDEYGRRGSRVELYSLYYAVRASILLDQQLTDTWKQRVQLLLKQQVTKGYGAGAFPTSVGRWMRAAGHVGTTAMCALTLEHALFLR